MSPDINARIDRILGLARNPPPPRVLVTRGLDLIAACADLEQAARVLENTVPDGDLTFWQGGQLLAVKFMDGTLLRVRPPEAPPPPAGKEDER